MNKVNKIMQDNMTTPSKNISDNKQEKPSPAPNESGIFYIDGSVKIFDPETQEIFVETRT
jgi:hypothetical protein